MIVITGIETNDNNHIIKLRSEGDALEMHNKLVLLRDYLPDLLNKLEVDKKIFIK